MVTILEVLPLVAITALFGGAVGSFAGVVACRGLRHSLVGHSRCDSCAHTLGWYELVPLVSFVTLRARCTSCGSKIGFGVYVWELAGASIALAAVVPLVVAFGATA